MTGQPVPERLRDNQQALTSSELCELLHITPRTLYRLVERGEIRAFRVGRDFRFWPDEVARFTSQVEPTP